MLSPELKKLKEILQNPEKADRINKDALLRELQRLDREPYCATRSISLPGAVCPTCGRKY